MNPTAVEYPKRLTKVGERGSVYRADLGFRSGVSAGLSPLEHPFDIDVRRRRPKESECRSKSLIPRALRLADRHQGSHRGLDREAPPILDVVIHEPLALLRDCLTDSRRDCTVAAEDLGAAIVDAE